MTGNKYPLSPEITTRRLKRKIIMAIPEPGPTPKIEPKELASEPPGWNAGSNT
ncbi:MAG: hypothetical protein QMD88_05370 [Coprothermobacterota bacterium]|nr:hypothetical protein [Coprothermobacterota bacterium]